MSIILFAIIVLIVAALVVAALNSLPVQKPFKSLILCLVLLAAALVIAQKAGLV